MDGQNIKTMWQKQWIWLCSFPLPYLLVPVPYNWLVLQWTICHLPGIVKAPNQYHFTVTHVQCKIQLTFATYQSKDNYLCASVCLDLRSRLDNASGPISPLCRICIGSSLFRISRYLNQCWVVVYWIKLQWKFNQNTKFFIHEIASQNIVCEMAAIFARGRIVK